MRKVRDTTAVPNGGWTYIDPDNGTVLKSPYFNVLMGKSKTYRRANNLPIGSQFNEQFEDILCANNPGPCEDFMPPSALEMASNLTKALYRWQKAGRPVRSEAEINNILALCRSCNFYAGETGLLKIVCQKCRCSKKKLELATEHCPIEKW